jgi:hypothetical protein
MEIHNMTNLRDAIQVDQLVADGSPQTSCQCPHASNAPGDIFPRMGIYFHPTKTPVSTAPKAKQPDFAASLALFLLEKTGTVLGRWMGKMLAEEQRALFGRQIGRGQIVIDGSTETICNRVKVCFGHDWDDRNVTAWRQLNDSFSNHG